MEGRRVRLVLGIDPGLSGAIAFLDPETHEIEIHDMPVLTITRNGKKKRTIDLYALGMLMDSKRNEIRFAVVEAPSSRPGEGVTSAFTFGFACAAAQMAVAANIIPMDLVAPATWKRALRLSDDKDASRFLASKTYPKSASLWPLVKHDGRAEAVLLAHYGLHYLPHRRSSSPCVIG